MFYDKTNYTLALYYADFLDNLNGFEADYIIRCKLNYLFFGIYLKKGNLKRSKYYIQKMKRCVDYAPKSDKKPAQGKLIYFKSLLFIMNFQYFIYEEKVLLGYKQINKYFSSLKLNLCFYKKHN